VVDVESSATLTLLSTPIGASADLLETMDLFGRRLRSKIGESIQTVQTAPPLTKVTTASTEALLHFDRANRAWFLDDDPARAVEELKRAVTIDTSFAAAWRMIGTAAGSARLSGRSVVLEPQFQNSLNRAFAQRAQATEEERLAIEGTYYTSQDLEKARIAYVALGKLTGDPTINLGFVLNLRRDFAAAESVYRAIYVQPNYPPFAYEDFIVSLMNQGKDHEADSVARLARSRFPNHVLVRLRAGQVFCGRRMFRECELAMDSIIASGATTRPEAIRTKAVSAMYQGQLERSHQLEAEIDGPLTSAGGQSYAAISPGVSDDLRVRRRFDRALAALNGIVDSLRTNELLDAAAAFSEAGAPDRAKSLFSRWEKEAPASARTNANYFRLHIALASIAHAERRYQDAMIEWKNADVKPPDKRASPTAQAMPFGIAAAYDSLQMRDSAIVWYERTLATPNYVIGPNWHPAMRNPGVHERLGQLYEAQGNSAKAIEHFAAFTELWKDADADLQPRVADARSRLVRLRAARP
jgi:tetratricopeptide (TPR) repeat protein